MVTKNNRRTINNVCECEHYKAYYDDYTKEYGCEREMEFKGYADCIPGAPYCLYSANMRPEKDVPEYHEKITNATVYEYIEAFIDYLNEHPNHKHYIISCPSQLGKMMDDYAFRNYIRSEHEDNDSKNA